MGNMMTPYIFAVGEKYTYFLSTHYKFIENDEIEDDTLLNLSSNSFDPFDYHVGKKGLDCFKKFLVCNRIHYPWRDMESDIMDEIDENMEPLVEDLEKNTDIRELEYTTGSNKIVKIFHQKCFICLERDSEYIFKQCGHQCIWVACYQNKGDIDILKCVICRT